MFHIFNGPAGTLPEDKLRVFVWLGIGFGPLLLSCFAGREPTNNAGRGSSHGIARHIERMGGVLPIGIAHCAPWDSWPMLVAFCAGTAVRSRRPPGYPPAA